MWLLEMYPKKINVFSIWLSHSIPSSLLCHKTMPSTDLRYEMWCLLFVYYTTYRKTGTHLSTFSFTYTLSHTLTQRPNPSKIYPHKVLLRIRPSSNRRSINSCRIIYLSNRIVWNLFYFRICTLPFTHTQSPISYMCKHFDTHWYQWSKRRKTIYHFGELELYVGQYFEWTLPNILR